MRNWMAAWTVGAIVAGGTAVSAQGAFESQTTPPVPASHIRSTSPAIAAVMLEATGRSETFRSLVATINASDGLVYVEDGKCGHGVRACLVFSVTIAGPYRLLRVVVDAKRADLELKGLLGHELQHVVEVLSNPSLTSGSAMYFFYRQIGYSSGDRFETEAARLTGDTVRAEARRNTAN